MCALCVCPCVTRALSTDQGTFFSNNFNYKNNISIHDYNFFFFNYRKVHNEKSQSSCNRLPLWLALKFVVERALKGKDFLPQVLRFVSAHGAPLSGGVVPSPIHGGLGFFQGVLIIRCNLISSV